jgi:DNA-binding CsgD family transcriptional regulator/tetratricopeptide (TPR) repeat protein
MLVVVSATPEQGIVGRDGVLQILLDRLDEVDPQGTAIGLVGDPGVGKSSLLHRVEQEARSTGYTVHSSRGSHSETHLPYASLHQLVRPLLPRVDALPVNQREALLACFAMGASVEVNPFFTSLAVLELLVDAAARAPLLVSLDDVDRMDQPSIDVLAFVARRVAGERVLFVATSRAELPAFGDAHTIHWIPLAGLDDEAAALLLESRSPGLAPGLRERVLRQAVGNPLALVEIGSALRAGDDEWSEPDEDLPMTARLEAAFVARADQLDVGPRTVLDVAAIDDGDNLHEVLAAAEALHGAPLDRSDLQPSLELGLVTVSGDRYRITHPLIGSALRHAMTLDTRHRAHAALAQVLAAHPDRALWHRAASASGPEEEVARALEQAAADARRRGAVATAVGRLERAAALSQDGEARVRRLLGAAELEYELGRFARVEQIRGEVATMPLSVSDRSRLTWLEGVFHDGSSSEPAEVRRLVGLARRATSEGDPDLALQLLFGAGRRVWWRDPGDDVRRDIVAAAQSVPVAEGDPRVLAVLALAESLELSPTVIAHLQDWPADAGGRPDLAGLLGVAAFCVGDHERAETYLSTAAVELRAQGRLSLLAEVLALRSWAEINLGVFDSARSADEAMRLGDETGQAVWAATARAAVAMVDAVSGRWEPDHGLLAEAEHTAMSTPNASSSILAGIQLARGVGELSVDHPERAYAELHRAFVPTDPAYQRIQQFWSLGYLADAAVLIGRRDEATSVVDAVSGLAGPAPSPSSIVAVEYARAVLADDASAEALFRAALNGAARPYPWHQARLQLAQGAWLRRQRRITESRDPLRAARGTFAALGASAWADRADHELRATGEPGWRPASRPRERLSVQESRIAELAAQGLSNREIGQRLFLSHRTVSSHLYRIFPKLGITSRNQLARALDSHDDVESVAGDSVS